MATSMTIQTSPLFDKCAALDSRRGSGTGLSHQSVGITTPKFLFSYFKLYFLSYRSLGGIFNHWNLLDIVGSNITTNITKQKTILEVTLHVIEYYI